jgi:hypothetical protein
MPKFDASLDWLWVQSSTPTVFTAPRGQSNLSHSVSRATEDASDKASYPDNIVQITSRTRSISLTVKPDYPDVQGIQRMESLFNSGTPEIYQIRKNGAAGNGTTDRIFECSMVITQFEKSHNRGELRSIAITLAPAAAATIDTLS